MGKYRDGLGIIADILHAAGRGSKKTRIMGVANLSYKLFEKYLGKTVQVGLIQLNDEGYEVTEKGQDFLEKYHALSSKYLSVQNELQSVLCEREILKRMCEPLSNGKTKAACGRKRGR